MAVDNINGSLQKRYPKVVFTSAIVIDKRTVATFGKGDTFGHEAGDKYYVQPLLKKGKRSDIYPNLATPFIDVLRVVKSENEITADNTIPVINATDLSEPLVGRINEYTSWASAINALYRQYLKEDNLDMLMAQAKDIMADHVDNVESWVDRDSVVYYFDELLLTKYAGVKQLNLTQFFTEQKKEGDEVFPVGLFMPVHNNLILKVTAGQTTLSYRGFIFLNSRGFPMVELLRIRNDDHSKIHVDKNDIPAALTLQKLYGDFFKAHYFDIVTRFMHHEKRAPFMIVDEDCIDTPERIVLFNTWGIGYEYLDSLSGQENPSASTALKYLEENPEGATAQPALGYSIVEQMVDVESGDVISEKELTPEEIQERAALAAETKAEEKSESSLEIQNDSTSA